MEQIIKNEDDNKKSKFYLILSIITALMPIIGITTLLVYLYNYFDFWSGTPAIVLLILFFTNILTYIFGFFILISKNVRNSKYKKSCKIFAIIGLSIQIALFLFWMFLKYFV